MSERTPMASFELDPALNFLRKLWRLNHAIERVSQSMDRTIGVTAQQRFLLRCIGRFPGITPGGVAVALHLHPATVSSTLRRLESKGLIQRSKDPHDSRRAILVLTKQGHALDRPENATIESGVEVLLRSFPRSDIDNVSHVLDRLVSILDEST